MTTADDNVELVRKGYAAFATADLAALSEIMSADVVHLAPGSNLTSGEYQGRDEVFGLYGKLFELSDGTFRVELLSAEPRGDDQVPRPPPRWRDAQRPDLRGNVDDRVHDPRRQGAAPRRDPRRPSGGRRLLVLMLRA